MLNYAHGSERAVHKRADDTKHVRARAASAAGLHIYPRLSEETRERETENNPQIRLATHRRKGGTSAERWEATGPGGVGGC